MSISGIFSSNLFNYQSVQNNVQKFQQEFQQLGQDLASGSLSAAQQDFATLQQLGPQSSSTTASQNSNPIAQAFSQLSQDLQSGNVSAAQHDYAQIQQDLQAAQVHHHHHHHSGSSASSQISQLFDQLGQALQSGNLTSAQQVYATLQQDLEQYTGAAAGQPSSQTSSTISVTA